MRYAILDSCVGPLTLASSEKGLHSVRFGMVVPSDGIVDEHVNAFALTQLSEYFSGKRTEFDLPLAMEGTTFQMKVWRALLEIPYGDTRSYADVAKAIGRPGASRAVGMANHQNRIPVVVPCHRVVGRDGSLTGYAGGLELKNKLLSIERRTLFT